MPFPRLNFEPSLLKGQRVNEMDETSGKYFFVLLSLVCMMLAACASNAGSTRTPESAFLGRSELSRDDAWNLVWQKAGECWVFDRFSLVRRPILVRESFIGGRDAILAYEAHSTIVEVPLLQVAIARFPDGGSEIEIFRYAGPIPDKYRHFEQDVKNWLEGSAGCTARSS